MSIEALNYCISYYHLIFVKDVQTLIYKLRLKEQKNLQVKC